MDEETKICVADLDLVDADADAGFFLGGKEFGGRARGLRLEGTVGRGHIYAATAPRNCD